MDEIQNNSLPGVMANRKIEYGSFAQFFNILHFYNIIFICKESDSDVYEDQLSTNLCSVPIFPPFYIGPCKRGHLIFNSDFDSGDVSIS